VVSWFLSIPTLFPYTTLFRSNLTNLLDLRPGRSIKVFLLISVIMLFTNITDEYNFILYSIYGILFIYFPIDLKAKAMMGDVGSRSEEHTSELQSRENLVCRLL